MQRGATMGHTADGGIRQRTETFAVEAVHLYRQVRRGADEAGRVVAGQFLRAAMSVGANVEEAQGAESRRDFRHKYAIARKEIRECRYWLRILARTGLAPTAAIEPMLDEASQLYAILTAIIKRLEVSTPKRPLR